MKIQANQSQSSPYPVSIKNYQRLHYDEYHIMLPDGSSFRTTRRECFAPPADLPGCPFKQRWYYSPDQHMAIRLPRNELGDEIGKANAAELRTQLRVEERVRDRDGFSRDAPINEDGDTYDVPDDAPALDADLLRAETVSVILGAVATLPPELQELWEALLADEKQCDIARRCGVTEGAIRKRIKKMACILADNPLIRDFFEEL